MKPVKGILFPLTFWRAECAAPYPYIPISSETALKYLIMWATVMPNTKVVLLHIIWIFQGVKINHKGTTHINVHWTFFADSVPFNFWIEQDFDYSSAEYFSDGTSCTGKLSNLHDIHVNRKNHKHIDQRAQVLQYCCTTSLMPRPSVQPVLVLE